MTPFELYFELASETPENEANLDKPPPKQLWAVLLHGMHLKKSPFEASGMKPEGPSGDLNGQVNVRIR